MNRPVRELLDLAGRVAIITGGGGLLGRYHAEAIAEAGGIAVLADIDPDRAASAARDVAGAGGGRAMAHPVDVTSKTSVAALLDRVAGELGRVDILINNAAANPKVEDADQRAWQRFEQFPLDLWESDLAVGLTGVFLCSQIVGGFMSTHGGGVIVNVASTLGLVSPDQRIYRRPGVADDEQMVKPATYSAIKGGVINLTRYLATYWADARVRVNAISPGGVHNGQDEQFIKNYSSRVPLGRMAEPHEYKGAILFLCSDASSYMTGANLVIDGGWTSW
jgi:NAD(P)-dependent dehydrogenase (short-subunit alcohol dehydrogenase family)